MTKAHITSAYDRDLEAVQALVMKMGGLVEEAIRLSARSLKARDLELSEQVRRDDGPIDRLEERINTDCATLIARRQPAARDLRTVLSVMKISHNLERIGDYAKNIAKRNEVLARMQPVEGATDALRRMAREVEGMLSEALDAYIRRDVSIAQDVRHRDIDVDQMYNALFREFLTFMMEDPRNITACMHLHFLAKNTERMGDHATSIAEQVIYLVTGELPDEARPKANSVPSDAPAAGEG